jgi:pilus assembly protein Flp/PilA
VREFPLEVIRSNDGRNANVFEVFPQTNPLTLETREVTTMMQAIRQFVKEEEGLAAAEYAMLLTLIAVALIGAITAFKNAIASAFNTATTNLS